jgi:hypothetical protein
MSGLAYASATLPAYAAAGVNSPPNMIYTPDPPKPWALIFQQPTQSGWMAQGVGPFPSFQSCAIWGGAALKQGVHWYCREGGEYHPQCGYNLRLKIGLAVHSYRSESECEAALKAMVEGKCTYDECPIS